MYEDPSPEPSRSGLIARILAAVGCLAAGIFAYLWLTDRDALRVARERLEREATAHQDQTQADIERAARERVNKEVAAERARHARELAKLKASQGTALERRLEQLGKERDGLLAALSETRERSQHLKDDASRLTQELETAKRSGAEDVDALSRQLEGIKSKMEAAQREAEDRQNKLKDLEGRMLDPLQGPLAEQVSAQVARVLRAPDAPDPERLQDELGRGAWLLPFLAAHFPDGDRGLRAAALVTLLDDLDVGLLMTGVARAGRTDDQFSRWIGSAFVAAGADGLDRNLKAGLSHESVAVRLAAVEASHLASAPAGALHARLIEALGNAEPEVADRAIERIASGGPEHRLALADLLDGDRFEVATRAAIWRRLTADADVLLPRLAQVVASNPGYIEAARGGPLPPERTRALLGELLAHPRGAAVDSLLERLLGVEDGQAGRTAWAAAVERPELRPHVLAAARRVSQDRVREQARSLLPLDGVEGVEPGQLLRLARIARPAHLPFLVAGVAGVSEAQRVRLAAALHRLGHPDAESVLLKASTSADPAVRAAAVSVAAALRLDGAPDLAIRRLYEGSPVREAAIRAASDLEVALPPEITDLLLSTGPPWADLVLDGLARHPEVKAARHRVLELLEDDLVVDADGAAAWAFSGSRRPNVASCKAALKHPHPVVRARALEAWRAHMTGTGDGALVRELEPFVKDTDFRVRLQATRTLAHARHDLARTTLVVLAKDPCGWVREAALRGLARQEPYHVVPVLRSALHDLNPYVRNAARLSLLAHGIKDEAPALLKDATDPFLGFRTRRALDRTLGTVDGNVETWAAAIEKH